MSPAPHLLESRLAASPPARPSATPTESTSIGTSPWHRQHLRGLFYSGSRPLSEPESRIAARLIRRVRPKISIWFHQHMGLVDESGGNLAVEQRYAELVELPLARLAREPGSVVGWENHILPHTTAFVVELPAGSLPNPAVRLYADAVATISR